MSTLQMETSRSVEISCLNDDDVFLVQILHHHHKYQALLVEALLVAPFLIRPPGTVHTLKVSTRLRVRSDI